MENQQNGIHLNKEQNVQQTETIKTIQKKRAKQIQYITFNK